MNIDLLVEKFERQFRATIDKYHEPNPRCAFAAGMLLILSALRRFDGASLPIQIAAMHTALRNVGESRGWIVAKQGDDPKGGG